MTESIEKIVERVLPFRGNDKDNTATERIRERVKCKKELSEAIASGQLIPRDQLLSVDEIHNVVLKCDTPRDIARSVHFAQISKIGESK